MRWVKTYKCGSWWIIDSKKAPYLEQSIKNEALADKICRALNLLEITDLGGEDGCN